MLVLTRKIGDSILIGDSIKIQIVHVKGCQVRVGIEAPKKVQIVREEISGQRQPSSQSSTSPLKVTPQMETPVVHSINR